MNLFLLAFAWSLQPALQRAQASVPLEVHGHRGARASRPENTLSAFRFALAAGVDVLEMDLNVTRDNVLVVTHDPFLNPILCQTDSGQRLPRNRMIRSLTLKELKSYDCGSRVNPRFRSQVPQPGERIPTFEEVLNWLDHDPNPRAQTIGLNVETKSELAHPEYAPPPQVFTRMVLEAFKKHRLGKRALLQSFDFRTLAEAHKIDPTQRLSALVEDRPAPGELVRIARELQAEVISPNQEWLQASEVEALHAIGVRVVPWTADSLGEWKTLIADGVDGIITDDPAALLQYLNRGNVKTTTAP